MSAPEKIYVGIMGEGYSDFRIKDDDSEYIRADIHEKVKEDSFTAGAKAVFDQLIFNVANNWHGNPEVDSKCQEENAIITAWATDALEDVSPESYDEWRNIKEMSKRIMELETELASKEPK